MFSSTVCVPSSIVIFQSNPPFRLDVGLLLGLPPLLLLLLLVLLMHGSISCSFRIADASVLLLLLLLELLLVADLASLFLFLDDTDEEEEEEEDEEESEDEEEELFGETISSFCRLVDISLLLLRLGIDFLLIVVTRFTGEKAEKDDDEEEEEEEEDEEHEEEDKDFPHKSNSKWLLSTFRCSKFMLH